MNFCDEIGPAGARCWLEPGHRGDHTGEVQWTVDEAPTEKLPPLRETVRRRPPAPVVRELSERVELLRALVDELAAYDEDGSR